MVTRGVSPSSLYQLQLATCASYGTSFATSCGIVSPSIGLVIGFFGCHLDRDGNFYRSIGTRPSFTLMNRVLLGLIKNRVAFRFKKKKTEAGLGRVWVLDPTRPVYN